MDELEGVGQINKLPFNKLVDEYIEWYSARRKSSSVKALKTHTKPFATLFQVYGRL